MARPRRDGAERTGDSEDLAKSGHRLEIGHEEPPGEQIHEMEVAVDPAGALAQLESLA